ncbi:alpha-amylase family glycosyl hydrolase [uncultured Flavobacterium sp.]|uniref:alpha-amylase family glycosyl hydrolase n=1 Tax=uncultured Flavobacterium sp. TaxID=165435 RepID=UPI0030ECC8D8|tara:strand:- start:241629 stop:244502 length:2874 start_codon:yes stop_codon:yes gene_type:complete
MNKKILLIFVIFITSLSNAQVTITPSSFNVTDPITITVNLAQSSCNSIPTSSTKVYMHAGIGDDTNAFGFSVVGNWGQDDGIGLMTNQGGGIWSITITPSTYFNLNTTQQTNATKLGLVLRNAAGNQEMKKAPSCSDFIFNVGTFQVNLTSPTNNSTSIITSGGNLNITATNTSGNASYNLMANGVSINTNAATANYSFNHTNITENTNYELVVTQNSTVINRNFNIIVNPTTITQVIPSGLEDGINYNSSDATKATLVLDAPNKDFVYVAGSFNNWQPNATYAMKKDPSSTKFWLELTGLTSGQTETYQYWVVDQTPIANSPLLVKTADPYSTLVLSPYDDPYISAASYPNMPTYPAGQEREVTVLKTGQTAYNWQVTNFTKPNKDNLVVYEVLIRDFDANRNFQDLINKIDYFKNLKVNAIELLPVMEFEGNESWGYNTSFHMALDKFYGNGDKLKEFVDLCHQNNIAVILDVALNHAFGRNPMVRMWMNDPDGDGWGSPSSESPYFNQVATHSYSVGNDFNHQQARTKNYVKRVVKQWIQEYKIDGFRWDLTKGFTQNATGSDSQTNAYQQDRVDVLKEYADYSWSLDPTHIVIFEHLGQDNEEQQWANYRLNEGKGILMWGELFEPYKQLELGYTSNASITRMGHVSRGFNGKRLIGYPESHDKDRLVYEAITYGNSSGANPVNGNLTNSIMRMSAIGATSILIPGPKMIWHFGALGMNNSIYTCSNGTVNTETDTTPGNCKLDTKPQPQWTNNWLTDPVRSVVYNNWAKFIDFKKNLPVFNGDYTISPDGNNFKQRIYVYDNSLPSTELKNVVILANFSVDALDVTPNFPYIGTWYNLMDNSPLNITSTSAVINIPSGGFRIYGNQPAILKDENFNFDTSFIVYPNPVSDSFAVSINTKKIEIYNVAGQLVKTFTNKFSDESLSVSDLQKGVYLVKVIDNNNNQATKKFIKQ